MTNAGALGLSGEVGLTPAWGLGSAREKLRMRMKPIGQTTGEPRQGFRGTAARTQTPNPDSGSNWGCAFNLSFLQSNVSKSWGVWRTAGSGDLCGCHWAVPSGRGVGAVGLTHALGEQRDGGQTTDRES